jgi:hypothetical protein
MGADFRVPADALDVAGRVVVLVFRGDGEPADRVEVSLVDPTLSPGDLLERVAELPGAQVDGVL